MKKRSISAQVQDLKTQETARKAAEAISRKEAEEEKAWAQLSLQIWGPAMMVLILCLSMSCKTVTPATVIHTACGTVDIVHSNVNHQTWIDFIKAICDRIRAGKPVTGDCTSDK